MAIGQPTSTGIDVFTYDAPSISGGPSPGNAPKKSRFMYTSAIFGADFSVYDLSGSERLGPTVCETTAWSSDSSLTAGSPSFGASPTNSFSPVVSVGARSGSETYSFTFDDAAISMPSALGNAPTTGSSTFGVFGIDFGPSSASPRINMNSAAEATRWSSDTAIFSRTPAGVSRTAIVVFTLGHDPGTRTEIFSFEAPLLRREISTKVPFGGGGGLFKWAVSYEGSAAQKRFALFPFQTGFVC